MIKGAHSVLLSHIFLIRYVSTTYLRGYRAFIYTVPTIEAKQQKGGSVVEMIRGMWKPRVYYILLMLRLHSCLVMGESFWLGGLRVKEGDAGTGRHKSHARPGDPTTLLPPIFQWVLFPVIFEHSSNTWYSLTRLESLGGPLFRLILLANEVRRGFSKMKLCSHVFKLKDRVRKSSKIIYIWSCLIRTLDFYSGPAAVNNSPL